MPHYDIVILGAGLGGLGMASQLKQAGRQDFVILEKEAGSGGTWRDNTYPGCACDTESHLYCYSFALHPTVSRMYARQPELLAYARKIVDDHDLEPHIRYRTEIVSVTWDEDALLWRIATAQGETYTARTFIAAWGQLNRPAFPDIPGLNDFAGDLFHSARWRDDVPLEGRRVASIGNAASAVQYIPEIAPVAGHLTVFQRSPNWIVPRGDRPYSPEELAGYIADPQSFVDSRDALFAWRETTFLRMREGSDEAREVEALALQHLRDQAPDEDLRRRLTPDFPLGCKRVLRSDDYYPALMRDNVELVTEPISHIAPEGVVTVSGRLIPLDVIILGTGFETQSFQGPVEVVGRADQRLRDFWRDGAKAYLGMTVPGFPNFFVLYGPNTNLGHNSILIMVEAQIDYILEALTVADAEGPLDIRRSVMTAYDDALQAQMTGSAWAGNCSSWYKNANGRVVNNWSGPVETYLEATARFDPDVYERVTAKA